MNNTQMTIEEQYYLAIKDIFAVVRRILGEKINTMPIAKEYVKNIQKMATLFEDMEQGLSFKNSGGIFINDIVNQIVRMTKDPRYACMFEKSTFFFTMLQTLHQASQRANIDRCVRNRFTGINEPRPSSVIFQLKQQLAPVYSIQKVK
ncbi:MAG: hypothetical protein IJ517_02005 [Alphaproteobacteria bacterium]|nr:hypothetical protein [Alphaproteobacteria bacterium]